MSGVEFQVLLRVSGQSDEIINRYCVARLREHGYSVLPPNQRWEKTQDFIKRLKISGAHFRRCIEHPHRPNLLVFPSTDRVQELLSNADFEAFVLRNKNRPPSTWKRASRKKPAHLLKRARMAGPKRNYTP
jgi:hypothetical protein